MTTPRLFPTFGLLAVLLASACAPAAASPTPALVAATPTESAAPTSLPTQPEATLAPTESALAQSVATSRGPNLEATDPATVALASGGLQLVEFFRFT